MAESLQVRLVPPAGPPTEVSLIPEAPGCYRASVTADQLGQCTLTWEDEDGVHRHYFVNRMDSARVSTGDPVARHFVDDGLLEEWSENSAAKLVRPVSPKSTLIARALVLLLATIAAERIPTSRPWFFQRVGEASKSGHD